MISHSGVKRTLFAVVSAAIMLISGSVWAADATSSAGRGSMELQFPVNVAGTQLQTGKYRVEWTGTGDQVSVTIYSGKQAAVSTHATLVKDGTWYDHVSYAQGEKGAKSLTQISFGKQKCSLRLENQPSSSDAQTAAK
ncbi:MAG TPA: hypothetical protein VJO35_00220 [Terriglobales bacterium]|nr:hypothetical protein [Terriglobales bacterium]